MMHWANTKDCNAVRVWASKVNLVPYSNGIDAVMRECESGASELWPGLPSVSSVATVNVCPQAGRVTLVCYLKLVRFPSECSWYHPTPFVTQRVCSNSILENLPRNGVCATLEQRLRPRLPSTPDIFSAVGDRSHCDEGAAASAPAPATMGHISQRHQQWIAPDRPNLASSQSTNTAL